MRTITHSIVAFSEMTEEQKAKAIAWMQDYEAQHGDNHFADGLDENYFEDLKEYGMTDMKAEWSGFGSQGDGASFTVDTIDVEKFLRKLGVWSQYRVLHNAIKSGEFNCNVIRIDSRYSHDCTVKGNVHTYWPDTATQQTKSEELEELVTEFIREQSRKYYRDLESAYDHSMSDEGIKDMIEANDYEFKFNEEGEIYALA